MGRRNAEHDAELPVDLWEYIQPYVAEEPAPPLEWAVRRAEPVAADERGRRVATKAALA